MSSNVTYAFEESPTNNQEDGCGQTSRSAELRYVFDIGGSLGCSHSSALRTVLLIILFLSEVRGHVRLKLAPKEI